MDERNAFFLCSLTGFCVYFRERQRRPTFPQYNRQPRSENIDMSSWQRSRVPSFAIFKVRTMFSQGRVAVLVRCHMNGFDTLWEDNRTTNRKKNAPIPQTITAADKQKVRSLRELLHLCFCTSTTPFYSTQDLWSPGAQLTVRFYPTIIYFTCRFSYHR